MYNFTFYYLLFGQNFQQQGTNYTHTCSDEDHTAQILQIICWPEKNDTAMDELANQKSSFSNGGVIFILLYSFRDFQSLSVDSDIVSTEWLLLHSNLGI